MQSTSKLPVSESIDIPISSIREFNILPHVMDAWVNMNNGNIPAVIDPILLPTFSLPYVAIIDISQETKDATVRLAGTALCDFHGSEMRGLSMLKIFTPRDVHQVIDDIFDVAHTRQPKLTQRAYMSMSGKFWAYTRLLLPISPNGLNVTRLLNVIEPRRYRAGKIEQDPTDASI